MKKILLSVFAILTLGMISFAQDTLPLPTVYLNFNSDWFVDDNKLGENATQVPLTEGDAQNPVWYNYNGNFPSLYGGFHGGDTLKYGGAAFFSGYKNVCDDDPDFPGGNAPASSRDVLFFAGNDNENGWDVIDTTALWQGVRKAFTITYWWRSERALTANTVNACPPDELPDWGEEEVQFDGGAFNGVDIVCYYNYYKFGYRNGSDSVDNAHVTDYFVPTNDDGTAADPPAPGDWIHVALVFDGEAQTITLYLNGTLAVDWEGKTSNPNPVNVGYSQFDGETFGAAGGAVLFGAENGYCPDGSHGTNNFWGDAPQYEGKYGYIEDHYRLGWPARGFLDEFAYWKDVALTQDQIKLVMNNEIGDLLNPSGVFHKNTNNPEMFRLYPNPATGVFSVTLGETNHDGGMMEIYNAVGERVLAKEIPAGENQMTINSGLVPGLYMVRMQIGGESSVQRLIINR